MTAVTEHINDNAEKAGGKVASVAPGDAQVFPTPAEPAASDAAPVLGDSDEQEPWMLEVGPQGQEQPQVKGTCEATPVNVSFIEYTRPCSKRTRVVDGAWESQAGKRSNKGTAIVKQFATFDEFADFRLKRSAKVMQMVGMFSADLDGATVRHRWAAEDGEITATKEYLTFRAEPGVVIIDTDVKGAHEVAGLWPEQPKTWPTPEAFLADLEAALPELKSCPVLVTTSTSGGMFDKDGKPRKDADPGWHTTIPVADMTEAPAILDRLFNRLLAAGLGWGFVSGSGEVLIRSPLDKAMKTVTQPNYLYPDIDDEIDRVRLEYRRDEGSYLSLDTLAWTEEAAAAARKAVATIKTNLGSAASQRKATYEKVTVERAIGKGRDPEAVRQALVRLRAGILTADMSVLLDDGTEVSVADLLTNGAEYDGRLMMDPLEPDYDGGRPVALFFWNNGTPVINSFAHEKHAFRLCWTRATMPASLDHQGTIKALRLLFIDPSEYEAVLKEHARRLGTTKDALRDAVGGTVKAMLNATADNDFGAIPDGEDKVAAVYRLGEKLPLNLFPHLGGSEEPYPLKTTDNIRALATHYGVDLRYNAITKRIESRIHSDHAEGANTALLAHFNDLCQINGISQNGGIDKLIATVATGNVCNPVTDYLSSLVWDGRSRFDAFADALHSSTPTARMALRMWLLQCVAAADMALVGRKADARHRQEYSLVPVFQSKQGVGKTSGIIGVVPPVLRKYVLTGHHLSVSNKDSVIECTSYWIVELGEVGTTFRKSDQEEIKNFLSRPSDTYRAPYGYTSETHPRTTSFCATTNADTMLQDMTGNRRYAPVAIEAWPQWGLQEIEQLWAEAWERYCKGEAWYPTAEEQAALESANRDFIDKGYYVEALMSMFDWESELFDSIRQTPVEIHKLLTKRDSATPQEMNALRAALRHLHACQPGKVTKTVPTKRGDLVVHTDGGKNYGWVMPPLRVRPCAVFDEEETR